MLIIPKSLTNSLQKTLANATGLGAEIKQLQESLKGKIHETIDTPLNQFATIDELVKNWKLISKISVQIEQSVADLNNASSALLAIDALNSEKALTETHPPSISNPMQAPATAYSTLPQQVTKPKKPNKIKKIAKPISIKKPATPTALNTTVAHNEVAEDKPTPKIFDIDDLKGNSEKLMRYFEKKLNFNTFTLVTQTAVADESGIPLGSLTALLKKLSDSGLLILGPSGAMKLGSIRTKSESESAKLDQTV